MNRQIEPGFFGNEESAATPVIIPPTNNEVHSEWVDEVPIPNTLLMDIKKQMSLLSSQISRNEGSLAAQIKSSDLKFERLQSLMTRSENRHNELSEDCRVKFNQIFSKLSERQILDAKMQDALERHQSILAQYESRLNTLKNLLAEKEEHLAQTQKLLNEAKQEIMRLKKY